MVKKKTGRYRRKRTVELTRVETSTQAASESDLTPASHPSAKEGRTDLWGALDSATGVTTDQESEPPESYAQSYSALIDKYVFSRKFVPFVLVVIVMFWLIIQDNGAGNLTDWYGILWTVVKCGVALALFLLLLLIQWVYQTELLPRILRRLKEKVFRSF